MARKTFPVDEFRAYINKCLTDSTCSPDERLAMASTLEHVLVKTDNYKGFKFVEPMRSGNGRLNTRDESRRYYY